MKLYIPSTTLNVDNILSCECISPMSVCENRRFGYKSFEMLQELKIFRDFTLAFSKIPLYSISDSIRDHRPIIFEIDVDDLENTGFKLLGNYNHTDIYAIAKPIYITPGKTKILFFYKQDLDYAYQSCADSAKCKLFNYFSARFAIVDRTLLGTHLEEYIKNLSIPSLIENYSESSYDLIKGFIWGYGIGYLISPSPSTAKLLKIQKRVYDIVSSSRNEKYLSSELQLELSDLDQKYSDYDPARRIASEEWSKECKLLIDKEDDSVKIVQSVLKHFGVEAIAKEYFLKKQEIFLRRTLSEYTNLGFDKYEQYNKDLQDYTIDTLSQDRLKNLKKLKDNMSFDIDRAYYKLISLKELNEEYTLFNQILRRVVLENTDLSCDNLRVNRMEVATVIVKTLKTIIEDLSQVWAGSEIQLYFDRLRKNISRYEPFNLNDIDNPVLQSLAAFILKGEDFDSLKYYLEINTSNDYRYAFALWGAMCGYVNIPRAIIESLLNEEELNELYTSTQKILGNEVAPLKITKTSPIHQNLKSQRTSYSFKDKVLEFFDNPSIKSKNKASLRESLLDTLNYLEKRGIADGYILITYLDNKPLWEKHPKPWEKIKDKFCPDYEERKKTPGLRPVETKKSSSIGGSSHRSLFDSFDNLMETDEFSHDIPTDKHIEFIYDANATALIKYLGNIPREIQEIIKKNIDYIQKAHRPGGRNASDPSDNKSVIRHLINLCISAKSKKYGLRPDKNTQEILKRLETILLNYYCGYR